MPRTLEARVRTRRRRSLQRKLPQLKKMTMMIVTTNRSVADTELGR